MATIQIKYSDIAGYLCHGDFYRSLNSKDPEALIEIPGDSYAMGNTASDVDGLSLLLRTMSFWKLDMIPTGVMKFCRQNDCSVWLDVINNEPDFVELGIHNYLQTAFGTRNQLPMDEIIEMGRWEIILYTANICRAAKNIFPLTAKAAKFGHLRLLKWLHGEGFPWHPDTCTEASRCGHLECLQLCHENGCPWDVNVTSQAAKNGHLHCLKYAHGEGLAWHPDLCTMAATNGHLACLQYAHQNDSEMESELYLYAAMNGHLSCVQYAHEQGLEWHNHVCQIAAEYGQMECLQYAHANGCPWDERVVMVAIQKNQVVCLQYALQQGCPIHVNAWMSATTRGHIDCARLLYKHGVPWDDEVTCAHAANHPSLE